MPAWPLKENETIIENAYTWTIKKATTGTMPTANWEAEKAFPAGKKLNIGHATLYAELTDVEVSTDIPDGYFYDAGSRTKIDRVAVPVATAKDGTTSKTSYTCVDGVCEIDFIPTSNSISQASFRFNTEVDDSIYLAHCLKYAGLPPAASKVCPNGNFVSAHKIDHDSDASTDPVDPGLVTLKVRSIPQNTGAERYVWMGKSRT